MKKLFALMLALIMSLSLVACGGGEAADDGAADGAADRFRSTTAAVFQGIQTFVFSPIFFRYPIYHIMKFTENKNFLLILQKCLSKQQKFCLLF